MEGIRAEWVYNKGQRVTEVQLAIVLEVSNAVK